MASLHAIDHIEPLLRSMQQERFEYAFESKLLELHFSRLKTLVSSLCKGKKDTYPRDSAELSAAVSIAREGLRVKIIRLVGDDSVSADEGDILLRTLRWLDRLTRHLWRVTLHLEESGDEAPWIPAAEAGIPVTTSCRLTGPATSLPGMGYKTTHSSTASSWCCGALRFHNKKAPRSGAFVEQAGDQ